MSAFALLALLGLAALATAGGSDRRARAFALEVPPAGPVVTIAPGRPACQGPFSVPVAFSAVQLWLARVAAPGTTLEVTIRGLGAVTTSGTLRVPAGAATSLTASLRRTVGSGARESLCLEDAGPRAIALFGDAAGPGSGSLHQVGRPLPVAVSAVMLSPHPRSLLGLLPTTFRRAALFRPAWFGAWTFWLLLGGTLAAFAITGVALARAGRAELEAAAPSPPTPRGSGH